MDTKRLVVGTVIGGVAMYLLGVLIFDLAAAGFYDANTSPAASALFRDTPLVWAGVLGTLALASLVTFVVSHSGASGVAQGFKIGAVVGFLVWFGVDFIIYSYDDRWNLALTIVDPLLEIVRTGLSGAVIAVVLTKIGGEASESAPAL